MATLLRARVLLCVRSGTSSTRGDLCVTDPSDGQRIFSAIAVKRKLGLAPAAEPRSSKADGGEPRKAAARERRPESSKGGRGGSSSADYGSEQVGRKLSVQDEDGSAWYDGKVVEFSVLDGSHLVRYEDGEHQRHFLAREEAAGRLKWRGEAPLELKAKADAAKRKAAAREAAAREAAALLGGGAGAVRWQYAKCSSTAATGAAACP